MTAKPTPHPFRHLPLPNTSKADEVIVFLEDYVVEHDIQIGDLLPHEMEIVSLTGLSRTCVREALTRLRALGIIESRRHVGTRLIRPLSAHNFMRILACRDLPHAAFGHVGGFRSAIELGFTKEIFSRTEDSDIAELRHICTSMIESSTSCGEFTRCEIDFHQKLIEMTENVLAMSLWQMLEPFFLTISPIKVPIPNSIIAKHIRVVDALEARDESAFRQEMAAHHDHKLAWDSERYAPDFMDEQFDS